MGAQQPIPEPAQAPETLVSGHSMLSAIAQQMAQALANAAVQVVQARRLQHQRQQRQPLAAALSHAPANLILVDQTRAAPTATLDGTHTSQAGTGMHLPSAAFGAVPAGFMPTQAVSMETNIPEAFPLLISAAAPAALLAASSAAAQPAPVAVPNSCNTRLSSSFGSRWSIFSSSFHGN